MPVRPKDAASLVLIRSGGAHAEVLMGRRAQAMRAPAVAAVRETSEETGLALGAMEGGALRPDLHALDHIVRAITPTASPIRFHARSFLADAAGLQGTLRGNGELLDLAWRPIDTCLALPLADITEFVLCELRAWLRAPHPPDRVPLFTYRDGRASIQR